MPNAEIDATVGFSRDEVLVLRVIGVEFVTQGAVGALGKAALLVDQGDDVHRFHSDQVQYALVVFEGDVAPVDVLVVVLLLFEFEDVMDEELLEVLVGVVDAQLFEAVALEILEAEDIQDAQTRDRGSSECEGRMRQYLLR